MFDRCFKLPETGSHSHIIRIRHINGYATLKCILPIHKSRAIFAVRWLEIFPILVMFCVDIYIYGWWLDTLLQLTSCSYLIRLLGAANKSSFCLPYQEMISIQILSKRRFEIWETKLSEVVKERVQTMGYFKTCHNKQYISSQVLSWLICKKLITTD